MQCREKSIFCMQYVCNIHCKYAVAHAYNMVAKIQSSSGWAFWYVQRSLRLAQDFGNVLASSCCTGSFSGVTTIFFKAIYFDIRIKECVSSFPFLFLCYSFDELSKICTIPIWDNASYSHVWINQTLWTNLWLASSSSVHWGMSITLFLLFLFLSYSFD